jgi:aminobenzoyl-glutamate utilization protein B
VRSLWQSLIPPGTNPPVEINAVKMERFRPELEKLRYNPAKYKTYLEQPGIEYPTI